MTIKRAPLNSRPGNTPHKNPPSPKTHPIQPTAAELAAAKLAQELAKVQSQIKEAEARAASAEARAAAAETAMSFMKTQTSSVQQSSPMTPPPSPKSQSPQSTQTPPPPPPPPPITTHTAATPSQKPSADPGRSDLLASIRAGTILTPVKIPDVKKSPAHWLRQALEDKFKGMNPDKELDKTNEVVTPDRTPTVVARAKTSITL